MLAFLNVDDPEPTLKLEKQEENRHTLLRQDRDQYTEIQEMNSWSPDANYTHDVQQTPIHHGYQNLLKNEENLYWRRGAVVLFDQKMRHFLGELRRNRLVKRRHFLA